MPPAALPLGILLALLSAAPDTIRISEIHFAPADPALEFVELFQAGDRAVATAGLSISDSRGQPSEVTGIPEVLEPGGYLVLVRDRDRFSARWPGIQAVAVRPWPTLNDTGDDVTVRIGGRLEDHVRYDPSWHDPRLPDAAVRSLERIDGHDPSTGPASWTTSVHSDGATPGRPNRTAFLPRGVRPGPGDFRITEILYEPVTDRLPVQPEFVEFVAAGPAPVDPNGVYLTVASPGTATDSIRVAYAPAALGDGDLSVAAWAIPDGGPGSTALDLVAAFPGSAGRLAADRVWPLMTGRGLRNGGATVTLHAVDGTVLDRVTYVPGLHHPGLRETAGVSLERVDVAGPTGEPTNWTSTTHTDGATPGYATARPDPLPDREALAVRPRILVPGSGDSHAAIRYHFFDGPSVTDLLVFDLDGRMVRTLASGRPTLGADVVYWDGTGDDGRTVRTGPYVLLVRGWTIEGDRRSARSVVVVARR